MWADQLINEYDQGRKALVDMGNELNDSEIDQLDKTHVNSMVRDMEFVIDWLKVGRQPGTLRGIDRRSAYQRRVLMDMDLFPSLEIEPEHQELSNEDKQAIVDILVILSVRERQCYVLHNAYQMSMSAIGGELNISKASVQKYIDRANKKISNKIVSYDCHSIAN